MPMLEQKHKQKIITSTITATFFVALLLLVVIMLLGAGQAGQTAGANTQHAGLGPLHLFEIEKRPMAGGGVEGSIHLLSGLIYYAVCSMVFALMIVVFRLKKFKESTD